MDTKNPPFFNRDSKCQVHQPVTGKIYGNIPLWLNGDVIRNGAGIYSVGEYKYNSTFDGLAVLHKFSIKNGQVTYQSRALGSDTYKKNMEAQRIVVSEFATKGYTDPCHTLFQRLKTTFYQLWKDDDEEQTDNCSVNVKFYGEQLYAMTETVFLRRIDPETLKTIGPKLRIRDYVALNIASAHPHVLPDGSVISMGHNFRHYKGPHYCIVKIPSPPTPNSSEETNMYTDAKIIAEIPARWKLSPSYYHSFGITENYAIFIETPLCFDIPAILTSNILNKTFYNCMKWRKNEKTRFYVVSLKDGRINPIVYETDDLFLFHHINSFEQNGHIFVDVAGYDNGDILQEMMPSISSTQKTWAENASARRYILPLSSSWKLSTKDNLAESIGTRAAAFIRQTHSKNVKTIEVSPQCLTENAFELPRINDKYNGKPYRFFYGLSLNLHSDKSGMDTYTTISKIDIETGKQTDAVLKDSNPSEPIFVPNPTIENAEEDDGVIISTLLVEENIEQMSLVILDAKTMEELARITFQLNDPVPSTFHGIWSPQINQH